MFGCALEGRRGVDRRSRDSCLTGCAPIPRRIRPHEPNPIATGPRADSRVSSAGQRRQHRRCVSLGAIVGAVLSSAQVVYSGPQSLTELDHHAGLAVRVQRPSEGDDSSQMHKPFRVRESGGRRGQCPAGQRGRSSTWARRPPSMVAGRPRCDGRTATDPTGRRSSHSLPVPPNGGQEVLRTPALSLWVSGCYVLLLTASRELRTGASQPQLVIRGRWVTRRRDWGTSAGSLRMASRGKSWPSRWLVRPARTAARGHRPSWAKPVCRAALRGSSPVGERSREYIRA